MAKDKLKYNNPYVGEVYGNILDQYHNPTYNLKLFMVREPEKYEDLFGRVDSNDIPPQDIVVLAQTGVTGNVVDDFVVTHLTGPNKTSETGFSFTIKQPGAASFFDQVALARSYLGDGGDDSKVPSAPLFFMDLTFKGYEANIDDEDDAGEPVTIAGPFRYRMRLADVSVEITERGSEYQFTATPDSVTAYYQGIYQLPQTFKTIGDTITDHITSLQEQYNAYLSDKAKVPDQVEFDLSQLIGTDPQAGGGDSLEKISDDSLLTSKSADAETANRIRNEVWKAKDNVDRAATVGDAPKISGKEAEQVYDEDAITHDPGTDINRVMATILSMCPEFYTKVTRKADPLDPKSEVNEKQAYVSWFKILTKVEPLEWDSDRKVFAKKYIYVPVLYKTARPDVAVDEKELEVSKESAASRIGQIKENKSLYKAYEYIFTGRNDQILSLDLKYNPKVVIMMPAKGGAIGDITIAAGPNFTNQIEKDKGLDPESQTKDTFNKQSDDMVEKKIGDLLSLKGFVDSMASQFGIDAAALKEKVDNSTSQAAGAFQDVINARTLASGEFKLDVETSTTRKTEDTTTTTDVNGDTYTPDNSGTVYSADILNPETMGSAFSAELLEKGYVTATDARSTITQGTSRQADVTNETQSGTYKAGSPRNKLFGYLTQQQSSDQFLVNIDLQLRGDPWYLGNSNFTKSSEEQANYLRGENSFWLEIRTPISYDPDTTDEDSALNSGYWKYEGTSQTFSAIYNINKVVCSFNNGKFTVDVKAYRTDLDAAKVEKGSAESASTDTSTQAQAEQESTNPDTLITAEQTQALLNAARQNAQTEPPEDVDIGGA